MSNANRAAIIAKIHKVLRKHYQPIAISSTRTVLEHLLYSAILENSDFETAEETFTKLQESFFDWNEVRVTTVTELAEVMAAIPDATSSAQRVKKLLQAVFETHYQYDLEALKKQNLGKSITDIEKFPGITPFMVAYLTQNALAGHAIALGRGALDVLIAVGAATEAEAAKEHVAGLERAIQKNKGPEFFSLLHQCGVDLAASPQSTRIKGILVEIDTEAKERLAAWNSKKMELAAAIERNEAAATARRIARNQAPPPPAPPAKNTGKNKAPEKAPKPTAESAKDETKVKGAKSPVQEKVAPEVPVKATHEKGKAAEKDKPSKSAATPPPLQKAVEKVAKEKQAKDKASKDKPAAKTNSSKKAPEKPSKPTKEKEPAKEPSHRLTKKKPK